MKPLDGSHSVAALTLTVSLAALAIARPCNAQSAPTGLDLTWQAPAGCPSGEAVRKRVRALVGTTLDSASRVRADGVIERIGVRYRLTLRMGERGEYERVIDSSSCADLAGAAAIALGLLVRGELETNTHEGEVSNGSSEPTNEAGSTQERTTASTTEPKPDASPVQPPPEKETHEAEPPRDPEPEQQQARSRLFFLQAPLLGVEVGALPRPNPTLGISLGLSLNHLQLSVGVRMSPAQTVRRDELLVYGADISRITSELRGCYVFTGDRFQIGPCLFASLHQVSATGIGEEIATRTERAIGFAMGPGAVAKLRLNDAFALVACAGVELARSRERVVITNAGEVDKAGPVALSLSGGFEWAP